MIETITKDIGDYTYAVKQLDALKGRKVFVRLANVLGPAFEGLGKGEDAVEKALGKLLASLREDDMEYFCKQFAPSTMVLGGEYADDPRSLQSDLFFGTHFAGKYLDMIEWLIHCVQANYSSFFQGIGAKVAARVPAKPAPALQSPPTSTGTSGES